MFIGNAKSEESLVGSCITLYQIFDEGTNFDHRYGFEGKVELLIGNSLQDGTYEIEGNSVKIRVGQNVYMYTRNGDNLQLKGGLSVLKKE